LADDSSQAIAQIYTDAIFEIADEQKLSKIIHQELRQLAELMKANPDFELFLENPMIHRDRKRESIARIFSGHVSKLMISFLKVLAGKGRLHLIREIEKCYTRREDEKAGRITGQVVTAIELNAKEKIRLAEQLGRALRKTVVLKNLVDPSIIGGMVMTIDDTQVDGSVKGALQRLQKKMQLYADEHLKPQESTA